MVILNESAVYIRTKCTPENVKKLNLWGCEIDDISLCAEMPLLEVLSLSVNKVETLEPLQNCKQMRELYLRKNNIQSFTEIDYLKGMKNLRVLWIDENPCTSTGEYRAKVLRILPQLTKLDDKAVTLDDHIEAENSDDSIPECDMHTSVHSARSSRSGTMMMTSSNHDLMSRSLYGRAIVDTVMQPQMVHYGDHSDDERLSVRETPTARGSRNNLMTQSVYGTVPEDEWGDFQLEDDFRPLSMDSISPRMSASMHESMMDRSSTFRGPPGYCRSVSMPRRRVYSRQQSMSPARDHRLNKIMSAVSVLLDELDQEGLRGVIDEAQSRIKKQH